MKSGTGWQKKKEIGYAAYKLGKLKIDDGNIREAVEHLSMADNKYALMV